MTEALRIGLAYWIIEDGNYSDWRVGDQDAFALEFYAEEPLSLRDADGPRAPSMTWLRDCTYAVAGHVLFATPEWWVVSFGPVEAYSEYPLSGAAVGDLVGGEIYLGVDPFFYFERRSRERGAPPLIYDWRIESIDLDVTPWVEVAPRSFDRDKSRIAWKFVANTQSHSRGDGGAAYVLSCTQLTELPRWTLQPPKS